MKTKSALLLLLLLPQCAWAADLAASAGGKCPARASLDAQVKCLQSQLIKMQGEIADLKGEREDLRRFVERLIDRRIKEAVEPPIHPLTDREQEEAEPRRKAAEEERKAEEAKKAEEERQELQRRKGQVSRSLGTIVTPELTATGLGGARGDPK